MQLTSRRLLQLSVLLLMSFTVQFSSCSSDDGQPAPQITSITPASGPGGTLVTIQGNGFSTNPLKNYVKFNGRAAIVQYSTENIIVVQAPFEGTTGAITIAVDEKEGSGQVFTFAELQAKGPYYIKFKVNGEWNIYQGLDAGSASCGDCACSSLPGPGEENTADVSICQLGFVTAEMITAFRNKTFTFDLSTSQHGSFGIKRNNIRYWSGRVYDQVGSTLTINDVIPDGTFDGAKAFKIIGTFSCKVAVNSGSPVPSTSITNGTFVVRFTGFLD